MQRSVNPFVVLGASLMIVLLLTTLGGIWHYNYELDHRAQEPTPTSSGQRSAPTVDGQQQVVAGVTDPAGSKPKPTASNPASTQPTTSKPGQPAPTTPPATPVASVTVSLSINNQLVGDVTLAVGSTQCDVLQKALEAGVLFSLDMRYSAQYKTYAVYVINGQGDPGAIWWTYSVNGKSPPYGCSGTKVAQGDSANWEYIKQ